MVKHNFLNKLVKIRNGLDDTRTYKFFIFGMELLLE
jgi:hypothetical protein